MSKAKSTNMLHLKHEDMISLRPNSIFPASQLISATENFEMNTFETLFPATYQMSFNIAEPQTMDYAYQEQVEMLPKLPHLNKSYLHECNDEPSQDLNYFHNQSLDYYRLQHLVSSPTSSSTADGSDNQFLEECSFQTPWSSASSCYAQADAWKSNSSNYQGSITEENNSGDKPYARLIYDALMEAPNHRMMLREIYEWFQTNTTKPQESGTNGWQNSIRHNLSMNKAFENDKTEIEYTTGNKKANSVWILTNEAIRHGIQSTTRYRKTGSTKKTITNRNPAIQRQKSGSKGGRAACRAARLRRNEQTSINGRGLSSRKISRPKVDESEQPNILSTSQSMTPLHVSQSQEVSSTNFDMSTPIRDPIQALAFEKSEFRNAEPNGRSMQCISYPQIRKLHLQDTFPYLPGSS